VRGWKRKDYAAMFRLLRLMGYDRVMLWPVTEAIPMPLSRRDKADMRAYRNVIEDARALGHETWLTFCASVIIDRATLLLYQAGATRCAMLERCLYGLG
jgi:hypothetical protein